MDRKFFYGDLVLLDSMDQPSHRNHQGIVMGTVLGGSSVVYEVDCECGARLHPRAQKMDLLQERIEDPKAKVQQFRYKHFLSEVLFRVRRASDRILLSWLSSEEMVYQTDSMLSKLDERDRAILTMRYGLAGENNKTLKEIANIYGVSSQRINQLQRRAEERIGNRTG